MNRLLIVAIFAHFDSAALCATSTAESRQVEGGRRNLVGIIATNKAKIQTYCQIEDLTEQLDQAVEKRDTKTAKALVGRIAELTKKMGPEFAALVDIEKRVDLNSPDGQEIASIVASLGESCGQK